MLKKTVLAFKVKIIVPKIVRQELQFDKVGLKTPSPNNQGLNFLLHVQFRQVLKNCVKASRARIPGKQAGIPGKQARIREERFYLLAIVCFLRTRLSRNGEAEMRNSESKQKRTNFPTGEDLGSGGISRVRQKNRSKHTRAQILACGGYRYSCAIRTVQLMINDMYILNIATNIITKSQNYAAIFSLKRSLCRFCMKQVCKSG